MTDFEVFVMAVLYETKTRLDRSGSPMKCSLRMADTPTSKYTALCISCGSLQRLTNLNDMYRAHLDGMSVSDIAASIIDSALQCGFFEGSAETVPEKFADYSKIKDRLFIRLSNSRSNPKFLSEVPHCSIFDLVMTCHILVSGRNSSDIQSITVRNSFLELWKISEETLFADAISSGAKLFPVSFDRYEGMYLLTNRHKMFGAASILYENALETVRDFFGSGFYILPSSIHEVILIPERMAKDPEKLKELVICVNSLPECLTEGDFLSDHVYSYRMPDGLSVAA